jgi:hypothetical protein
LSRKRQVGKKYLLKIGMILVKSGCLITCKFPNYHLASTWGPPGVSPGG